MTAIKYKDHILGVLCFRYLSEKLENFLEQQGILPIYENEWKDSECQMILRENLGFFLKPEHLWTNLIKKIKNQNFTFTDLDDALLFVEETSKESEHFKLFENLFCDVDLRGNKLGETETEKSDLLSKLMLQIDNICSFGGGCIDFWGMSMSISLVILRLLQPIKQESFLPHRTYLL
ncbi:MAG: type I restriction-modification system subunit M N-terminal domain-containing protein [Candidatus Phytoplasma sp. TWB_XP]